MLIRGKIRDRTYQILIFGLYHKALTVTANKGAIESAKQQVITSRNIVNFNFYFKSKIWLSQGLNIPCVVHEARALSEQKQSTAKFLKRN